MATSITTNLNDEDEAVLNRLATEYNTSTLPAPEQLTPAQFFRQYVRDWLRSQASRFLEKDQVGMRAAYRLATPEEQAAVDVILDKYR